jgi:hypothetical protein
VLGGIAGTLGRRWRIASKDRVAEVGAGAVVGQGQTGEEPGQRSSTQDASNAPQGLTARGRGRNGFGHLIKNIRIHQSFPPFQGISETIEEQRFTLQGHLYQTSRTGRRRE